MEKILFCSVPLHFLASVNVFSDNRSFFFFSTPKPVLVRSGSQSSTLQLLFLPYYLLHLFPPLISFFLSPPPPPSSHSWKSISGHTIRGEGGERRNLPAWDCTWMPRKASPAVRSYCSPCQRLPVLMSLYIIIVIMSDDWGGPCTMESLNVDPESHWMKS